MIIQKPSIPKGTRDFGPDEMARRNYLFDTIREIFRKYGYLPLETPSMENLTTLLGKYGEEGDKLLFKILNSGNFLKAIEMEEMTVAMGGDNPAGIATKLCEKGLRYDLTVPFARYVVQHQHEITFPFKRYQIQPVWRADRPQKGRYREFCQCDVDVIGTRSLVNEVELIQIVQEIFGALGIRVTLKMNNRKILAGIAACIGYPDMTIQVATAIDQLDKYEAETVRSGLTSYGIDTDAVTRLFGILEYRHHPNWISRLKNEFKADPQADIGLRGIAETETIIDYCRTLGIDLSIDFDLSLARGLNYYTGTIFEVKAMDWEIGSICGGGRYDDLTGIFGMPDTSGVGISFGADRIYDVMLGLDLFPKEVGEGARALFVNFGGEDELAALRLLAEVRKAGVAAEIYPEAAKMKKQFDYAEKKGIVYMVFVGEDERAGGGARVKNIVTGIQEKVNFDKIAEYLEHKHK